MGGGLLSLTQRGPHDFLQKVLSALLSSFFVWGVFFFFFGFSVHGRERKPIGCFLSQMAAEEFLHKSSIPLTFGSSVALTLVGFELCVSKKEKKNDWLAALYVLGATNGATRYSAVASHICADKHFLEIVVTAYLMAFQLHKSCFFFSFVFGVLSHIPEKKTLDGTAARG
jgi:hypothetical protein